MDPNRALVGPRPTAEARLKKAGDNLNQGLGADGVVQDSTRAVSLVMRRASVGAKAMRVVADFTNGEGGAVDKFVRSGHAVTTRVTAKVAPRLAGPVERTLGPVMNGAGATFKFLSKWAQVLALPFAIFDVRDAITAKDPKEKRAAIANATFSVVGGIAGAIGGFAYATPVGLPLLAISTATGLFQIADHFIWKGKGMDFLGEHVVAPLEGAFGQSARKVSGAKG